MQMKIQVGVCNATFYPLISLPFKHLPGVTGAEMYYAVFLLFNQWVMQIFEFHKVKISSFCAYFFES